ncbi:MAG: hypothetical protein GXP09_00630, partial [Gammaproteobacteria bacterium]|nr:hypothetical protein [Gammaproteobacteria bacterium]
VAIAPMGGSFALVRVVAFTWNGRQESLEYAANYACFDTEELANTARHYARSLQRKQHLLRSFVNHSPLSLRLR